VISDFEAQKGKIEATEVGYPMMYSEVCVILDFEAQESEITTNEVSYFMIYIMK
jgi:hypothetical protein